MYNLTGYHYKLLSQKRVGLAIYAGSMNFDISLNLKIGSVDFKVVSTDLPNTKKIASE